MGMERVVADWDQLDVLLSLLPRSATGQAVTTYVSAMTGPRQAGESDGPDEFHLVIVDNGRSAIAGSEFAEMLSCIRCGACLNVCPVYRQVGGHAYGWVYSGPMGAVLTPLLARRTRDGGRTRERVEPVRRVLGGVPRRHSVAGPAARATTQERRARAGRANSWRGRRGRRRGRALARTGPSLRAGSVASRLLGRSPGASARCAHVDEGARACRNQPRCRSATRGGEASDDERDRRPRPRSSRRRAAPSPTAPQFGHNRPVTPLHDGLVAPDRVRARG